MSNEKKGSKAILDAVSPETRAGILENLEALGVTRAEPSGAPPRDPALVYDVVLTGFSTPDGAESIDREGEWYYVEGVRYCLRCQTRRCQRQVGGSLPCNDRRGFPEGKPTTVQFERFKYGIFVWTQSGHFTVDRALALFVDEKQAVLACRALDPDGSSNIVARELVKHPADERQPMVGLLEAIHQKSRAHRRALEASPLCGCFHCLRIFPPSEIREWVRSDALDTQKTCAVCPHCSVDAVLASIDVELTPALLATLQSHWFAIAPGESVVP